MVAGVATLAAGSGCVQDVGPGPDVGACAQIPDGLYGYGEVGIGTCLAGPVDVRFANIAGRDVLLVSNADPFITFRDGGLLVVEWDSVSLTTPFQTMDQLRAAQVEIPRFGGEIGLVLDRPDGAPLALVPTRDSAGSLTTAAEDDVQVLDLADPSAPRLAYTVPVGADPFAVETVEDRAYVLNVTAGTLSTLASHQAPVAVVDTAIEAEVLRSRHVDADDSGSTATVAEAVVTSASDVPTDRWTLTWQDPTWRVWTDEDGIWRRAVGSDAVVASATGADLESTILDDPPESPFSYGIAVGDDGDVAPALLIASGGNLWQASTSSSSGIDGWTVGESPIVRGRAGGWDAYLAGGSLFSWEGGFGMVAEGRVDATAAGQVGFLRSATGDLWEKADAPALSPAAGASLEDPFGLIDPFAGDLRVWVSHRGADGAWSVRETRTADASVWAPITAVQGLPDDAASPAVVYAGGRYHLWFVRWTGDGWMLARGESVDGTVWSNVRDLDLIDAGDPLDPPRPAPSVGASGGFQVDSAGGSVEAELAVEGTAFDADGFRFRVVTGFVVDGARVQDQYAAQGIKPGTITNGSLWATVYGSDAVPRIARFEASGSGWSWDGLALDPESQGLVSASDPVVYQAGGVWRMLFAAPDQSGDLEIRLASSSDGVTFVAEPAAPLDLADATWARDGAVPGSIEVIDGGYRLWYTGIDAGRYRIGSAVSTDGVQYTAEEGDSTAWQVGPGAPGAFDNVGVADPRIFRWRDEDWLALSGYDGDTWRVGLMRRTEDGWERGPHQRGPGEAWFAEVPSTFAAGGVYAPVPVVEGDQVRLWFAGLDRASGLPRVGVARGDTLAMIPEIHWPTPKDQLSFSTVARSGSSDTFDLGQRVGDLRSPRVIDLNHDVARGFVYTATVTGGLIGVLDVRDDSRPGVGDASPAYEAMLRVRSVGGGFRSVISDPSRPLLYAVSTSPDALVVLDIASLVDNDAPDILDIPVVASFPLRRQGFDAGVNNDAGSPIGGARMALVEAGGRKMLYLTHFLANEVVVFDLALGAYGQPAGVVHDVGENPYAIAASPDGRHLVVGNYLGVDDDKSVRSTLAVIDSDPASPTFLTVLTRLGNR